MIALYKKAQKKPKVGDKGFEVDPDMIMPDGRIIKFELVHDPFDTKIFNIVNRLFDYE